MKDKVLLLVKHPLILGSTIIFFGSMGASLINYLFNLGMGRLLSVADYGTFASLVSLFNIFSVFSAAIMLVFSKFSAVLAGQKKENLLGSLMVAGNIWVGLISLGISLILIIFSSQIAQFLKIDNISLILLTIASLFFSFISSVPSGALQGLLKFTYFSFMNISSSVVKLVVGIFLVFIGWKVFGAITAFLVSILASYVLSFLPLLKHFRIKASDGYTLSSFHGKAYSYAIPVFLSSIGIMTLISADIILAKHFFSAAVAGQYAALSLMGRSIFYVASPISSVFFPLIVQKKEKKEALTGTLLMAIFLIGIPSIILTLIYFAFPYLVLKVFFPAPEYLPVARYLGLFSIFILLYSACFILNSFFLSIGKTKVFLLTILAAVSEILFILIWHQSIERLIMDLILASSLLLISLLLYYKVATRTS